MKASETAVIPGVAWGSSFKVTEVDLDETLYNLPTYSVENADNVNVENSASGRIPMNVSGSKVTSVTVNNSLKNNKITVQKIISGNMADEDDSFEFVLVLTRNDALYTVDLPIVKREIGGKDIETGSSSYDSSLQGYLFNLKDNQELEFTVPSGCKWQVKENRSNGYTSVKYEVNNNKGKVDFGNVYETKVLTLEEDITVTFTNTKEITTPTGIFNSNLPYMLMLAIAVVGTASFVYPTCRRRRQKRER